jgi:hypothetical protein
MELDKKTTATLEKVVEARTEFIEINEDFGFRCLHLSELYEELKGFYEVYNPDNDFEMHQSIFEGAVSYLENKGWVKRTFDGIDGYLMRGD